MPSRKKKNCDKSDGSTFVKYLGKKDNDRECDCDNDQEEEKECKVEEKKLVFDENDIAKIIVNE